jgi:hypothetical protein
VCLNLQDGQDVPLFLAQTTAGVRSRLRRALKAALYRALDRAVCRPLGIPAAAFFPLLALSFRKEGAAR